MKAFIVLSSITLFLPLLAVCGGKSVVVTVENPSDIERNNETIEIQLNELTQKLGSFDGENLIVENVKDGILLLSQLNEHELLFQADFKPFETREFMIGIVDKRITRPQSLVDGRFELPREDYAWENDRIAFRMYGPALAKDVGNGIDVWTKRVRYLIVEKWYRASKVAGKDTYHEDHDEGADFFSVGKSLGAGGSGLWLKDSLYQPGVFSTQRTICNGPIRVAFELTYANLKFADITITERKRISLDAGQYLNRIEVSFDGLGSRPFVTIACGLVKRANTAISQDEKNCWMSLWGLTNTDTINGFLGTGVVLSPSSFKRFEEDRNQYLILGRTRSSGTFTYYAGAGWTRSGDFLTRNEWNGYLDSFSRRMQTPLKIFVSAKE